MRHSKLLALIAVIAALLIAAGCGTQSSLTGTAAKGAIRGATVTVYELNSDGGRGDTLTTTVTGTDGGYSVVLGAYAGSVEVVITGGTYTDEATGTEVTLGAGDELRTFVASVGPGQQVAVTALTTIAAALADENADQGLSIAIENANSEVADEFGLGTDFDITAVQPDDLTQPAVADSGALYGAVLAGISEVAASNGLTPSEVLALLKDMAEDYTDGTFDGTNAAGDALTLATSLAPAAADSGLETAIQNFLGSAENESGLTWIDLVFSF